MSETGALPAVASPLPAVTSPEYPVPLFLPAPAPALAAAPAPTTAPAPETAPGPAADSYDILILDASTRQSLASVRSLGRAGLRVAVGESFDECDPALPVLAFRSRYSARNVILPSFAADPVAFAAAVLDFVREHPDPGGPAGQRRRHRGGCAPAGATGGARLPARAAAG